MSKITRVFASGTIGNIIFYERQGTPCARSRPAAVKQTTATKEAGKRFGQAKTISRQLRTGLTTVLNQPKARDVMYKTDQAIASWLKDGPPPATGTIGPPLSGLEFNNKTSMYERFRKEIRADWSLNGEVTIAIPAFDPTEVIISPAHTVSLAFRLAISGCTLEGNYLQGSSTAFEIEYRQGLIPAKEISLNFTPAPQSVYICVAALQYSIARNGNKETAMNEAWLPATVMSSFFMT
jgi:hypothetical protein